MSKKMIIGMVVLVGTVIVSIWEVLRSCELQDESKPVPAPAVSSSAEVAEHSLPPPPVSSADAGKYVEWDPADLSSVRGRWVHAKFGDSIPNGPKGDFNKDGARFDFVKGAKGSSTPYDMTFWLPTKGHRTSKTIVGGCGFYPRNKERLSMNAFCRGWGLPKREKAHKLPLMIDRDPSDGFTIRVILGDLFVVELKPATR